jgi:hypothetical protein
LTYKRLEITANKELIAVALGLLQVGCFGEKMEAELASQAGLHDCYELLPTLVFQTAGVTLSKAPKEVTSFTATAAPTKSI